MEKITDVEIYCELDYNSSGSFKEYYPAAEVDAAFQAVRELVEAIANFMRVMVDDKFNKNDAISAKEQLIKAIAAVEQLTTKDQK